MDTIAEELTRLIQGMTPEQMHDHAHIILSRLDENIRHGRITLVDVSTDTPFDDVTPSDVEEVFIRTESAAKQASALLTNLVETAASLSATCEDTADRIRMLRAFNEGLEGVPPSDEPPPAA